MSVICRRAEEADREAFATLWMQAFVDPAEEINAFFDTFDFVQTAFALYEDGQLCTMLFLLPATIRDGARRYAAGYIYAGATRPESRGKGYYRQLLAYVAQTAKREGMQALFLRPATEELFDTYRRLGFTVSLYGNACPLSDPIESRMVTAAQYTAHRRALLDGQAFVDWDDRTMQYAFSWCRAYEADNIWVLTDDQFLWEALPAKEFTQTALLMPLSKEFQTTVPIWFGYGLQ